MGHDEAQVKVVRRSLAAQNSVRLRCMDPEIESGPHGSPKDRSPMRLATASVVFGIVGIYPFALLASIPALVLGYRARKRGKEQVLALPSRPDAGVLPPPPDAGRALRRAQLGILLGYVGLLGWSALFGYLLIVAGP